MKIIQITDTHLFADDRSTMYGVKTNITIKNVISKLQNEDIHDTDFIILTGDISQDKTAESYQKIADLLSEINIPIYWIPGNHDNPEIMRNILQKNKNFYHERILSLPHWHFILINTSVDLRDDGYIVDSELKILKNELAISPNDKKLGIIMHHHPCPVNTPLIDNYILKNATEFWHCINKTRVELIICGHVHGDYSFKYNNVMIEASPATCLQWEKGTRELITNSRIGYKIYHLNESGYRTSTKMW